MQLHLTASQLHGPTCAYSQPQSKPQCFTQPICCLSSSAARSRDPSVGQASHATCWQSCGTDKLDPLTFDLHSCLMFVLCLPESFAGGETHHLLSSGLVCAWSLREHIELSPAPLVITQKSDRGSGDHKYSSVLGSA